MKYPITMKTVLLGLSLLVAAGSVPAVAGDVYVISHPSVTLTTAELRDAYLGEKQFAGSIKLVPVDNAAVQSDFLAKALNMDAGKYASLWIKKGFRGGLASPSVKLGDAEVVSFVKNTPGAIGYVSAPVQEVMLLHKY
ncbi:MAG: hypothetical protein Q7S51_08925 [Gallionellaceae bacterium]|nr:hypothetical protein [Gallionellaceae bacterium]